MDINTDSHESLRELARSLDCILDEELQALAGVKAETTQAWNGDAQEGCSRPRLNASDSNFSALTSAVNFCG